MPLGRLIFNKDGRYLDVWAPTIFELDMAKRALLDGMHAKEPDWRVLPREYQVDWQAGGAPVANASPPQSPSEIEQLGRWRLGMLVIGVVCFSLGFLLARLWHLGC